MEKCTISESRSLNKLNDLFIETKPTPRTPITELYLSEVKKNKRIAPATEVELAKKIKNGDINARNNLVLANLRFSVSVAKQNYHRFLEFSDLINESNIGMIRAANKFDETRGFKFVTHGVYWMRNEILTAISNLGDVVRIPYNLRKTIRLILRVISEIEVKQCGIPPSLLQIVERIAIIKLIKKNNKIPNEEEIESYIKDENLINDVSTAMRYIPMYQKYHSLDIPLSDDSSLTPLDLLVDDHRNNSDRDLIHDEMKIHIRKALDDLSDIQKKIVCMQFGIDCEQCSSYETIAFLLKPTYDMDGETVRKNLKKALHRLSQNVYLKSYIN